MAGPKDQVTTQPDLRLDGTRSTSTDGKPLTYTWRSLDSRAAILMGNTATPIVQFATRAGIYLFQLEVTDSSGNTSVDQVRVTYIGR